eukprot:gene865-562_t
MTCGFPCPANCQYPHQCNCAHLTDGWPTCPGHECVAHCECKAGYGWAAMAECDRVTAMADGGWRMADGGRRTADGG